jgi:hypothetical protein
VVFEAFTEFCRPDGTCIRDIDDAALTFTAEFEGVRVVYADPYRSGGHHGTATWIIEPVPGPGGLVRGVVTASPADVFQVRDVLCWDIPNGNEMPWSRQGNTVSFEFVVPAIEPDIVEGWGCVFDFDLATLPRDTPRPSRANLPPTDAAGNDNVPEADGASWLTLTLLAGVICGAIVLSAGGRRRTMR